MHRNTPSKAIRSSGLIAALLLCCAAEAQISLATAVNMALTSDTRVKLAEADLAKAKAVLSQTRDAFVPAVAANGGVGRSNGAPLSPPVVFSMAAQSLVYSASQADYIHAARAGIESAQLALDAARSDLAEDVALTYVTLDNALERRSVQAEALAFAGRLVHVTQERFDAGVDQHLELTKARHTEAQIHLQQLLVDDEIATQTEHLARLTGLPAPGLATLHDTIPVMQPPAPAPFLEVSDPAHLTGTSAAFSAARAKQLTARGDTRYLLRPQVAFAANYARISTAFTNYEQYYPRFGANNNSFNSLSIGVQLTLPILDMVHRAKAREAAADAAHSLYEARLQQVLFLEGRSKLHRSAAALAARHDLARLEHDLAQDQLDIVTARLQAGAGVLGGEQSNPKDDANARLGERQRALDMLNATLQLAQTEVMLMRQDGSLANWLAASLPVPASPAENAPANILSNPSRPAGVVNSPSSAPGLPSAAPGLPSAAPGFPSAAPGFPSSAPGLPSAAPSPALPPTVGAEPGSAVPTTGTPPASLPSSPVTTPALPSPPSGPPPSGLPLL